jgi:hypothetical protein
MLLKEEGMIFPAVKPEKGLLIISKPANLDINRWHNE